MRVWIALAVLAVVSSGCTHFSLRRNTIKQAGTLSDLQYQQVLDNLAMFACNPDALPWHLKLSGAATQVTDECGGVFGMEFGGGSPAKFLPGFDGRRGVVEAWNGAPAVDSDDLEVLQLAYRRAVDPGDSQGVRKDIYKKIGELSIAFNIPLSKDTLDDLIDNVELTAENADKRDEWKDQNVELRSKLKNEFDDLVTLSDVGRDARLAKQLAKMDEKQGWGAQPFDGEIPPRSLAFAQGRVAVEDQIIKLTREIIDLPYVPRYPISGRPEHNVHEVDQISAKIKTLEELAKDSKYFEPWFCVAHKKKAVPKCACYVGHARTCGCECYVWVPQSHRATLRDFTIAVLTLAPLERTESAVPLPGGGIMYSPSLAH